MIFIGTRFCNLHRDATRLHLRQTSKRTLNETHLSCFLHPTLCPSSQRCSRHRYVATLSWPPFFYSASCSPSFSPASPDGASLLFLSSLPHPMCPTALLQGHHPRPKSMSFLFGQYQRRALPSPWSLPAASLLQTPPASCEALSMSCTGHPASPVSPAPLERG